MEYGFPDHEPQIDITPNTDIPVVNHSEDLNDNGVDTTSKSPSAEQWKKHEMINPAKKQSQYPASYHSW